MSWSVNSRGERINIPQTLNKDANSCMQRRTQQKDRFCLGYPSSEKKVQKRAHQRRTTARVSHTFHTPHCSPLVRNNNYGCATKPFTMDKARYGNSRSLACSKGLLLEGAKTKLGEPLCIALTRRQHQQRCSAYAGAEVAADTRVCYSNCCGQKN